jgi:hypothetical protein
MARIRFAHGLAASAALAALLAPSPARAGGSCGDGTCDTLGGEDCETCAADCACDPGFRCNTVAVPAVCVDLCGNSTCDASDGEDNCICPADCAGACCGDGLCSASETPCGCPADCPGFCCGNAVCDFARGENSCECPGDCPGPCCGNGTCESNVDAGLAEDSCTCPEDCAGSCCGDDTCAPDETCLTCPEDCACPPDMGVTEPESKPDEGCGCRVGAAAGSGTLVWVALFALIASRRRSTGRGRTRPGAAISAARTRSRRASPR